MAAKHVISLTAKIAMFFVVMLLVAIYVPYDGMVNTFIYEHISLFDAEKIGQLVSGGPEPEPYEAVSTYINIIINTLISVPLLSVAITVFNMVTRKVPPADFLKTCCFSTLRRLTKLFFFTFLSWGLLRVLPYQMVFPDTRTYSSFTMAAVVIFHMVITIMCYWFFTKKIIFKRSL